MIAAAALLLAPATASGGPLTVVVHNVRNARGELRIDVCPKQRFLADGCPWHSRGPAVTGTTTLTLLALPPGDYAVQAFHDENDNDRVDRALFGIPKEGIGFSRDARIVLGPPKWRDAVFTHGTEAQTIEFSLRYFLGPSGPDKARK
ncbi:MAG: DUF2141 domain-containing protein [Sphingomonadales bacterium]|nr:DUF2141 domain-containing protein [Sphingomonadales bacterium]